MEPLWRGGVPDTENCVPAPLWGEMLKSAGLSYSVWWFCPGYCLHLRHMPDFSLRLPTIALPGCPPKCQLGVLDYPIQADCPAVRHSWNHLGMLACSLMPSQVPGTEGSDAWDGWSALSSEAGLPQSSLHAEQS